MHFASCGPLRGWGRWASGRAGGSGGGYEAIRAAVRARNMSLMAGKMSLMAGKMSRTMRLWERGVGGGSSFILWWSMTAVGRGVRVQGARESGGRWQRAEECV